MSGSRKSLQRAAQTFNPRAENSWSKDDSKFGQKMLEKMGWKKGEGIGRDGQGVKENIKIRWKVDSKGLGFQIKKDEWEVVEQSFSKLLSNLSKECSRTKTTKLSLESTSSSSRSRMHYRKFIRGKDISKYSKKDLSGILGTNAEISDEYDSDHSANGTNNSCAKRMKFSLNTIDDLHMSSGNSDLKELRGSDIEDEKSKTEDLRKVNRKKQHSRKLKLNSVSSAGSVDTNVSLSLVTDDSTSTKKVKKRKLNLELRNYAENGSVDEPKLSELRDFVVSLSNKCERSSKTKNPDKTKKNKSSDTESEPNPTSPKNTDFDSVQMQENIQTPEQCSSSAKKRKNEVGSNVKENSTSSKDTNFDSLQMQENTQTSEQCSSSAKKRKNKVCSNVDENSTSSKDTDFDSLQMQENTQTSEQCSSSAKKRKNKVCSNVDENSTSSKDTDFDSLQMQENTHTSEQCSSSAKKRKNKVSSIANENSTSPKDTDFDSLQMQENTQTPKPCFSSAKKRKDKISSNMDDFNYFMQKVKEFNASTDPKTVIEEFEKNKEALLKRYRESYLRNYLESANENDSRIYCDLNGDEIDCKNVVDEGGCVEADLLEKMKQAKHGRERPLTKAERIILKARLLKAIQNKSCSHKFAGSNLTDIMGYGNKTVST